MDNKKKRLIRDYIYMIIGSLLISIASKNIYDPAGLIIGGVSGISIILRHLFGLPLWLSNTVINIPLFGLGYITKGWKFIARTIFATMLCSLILYLLPDYTLIPADDLFLASVIGAILMGIGCGLVFAASSTTGGTDLMAAIIQTKFKHISIPKLLQFCDGAVVLWGLQLFGVTKACYAIVSVYVFTKLCDSFIDGMHFAKAVTIISNKGEEISQGIMKELERGVTGIDAKGMYTRQGITMLYCVLSPREVTRLKDQVYSMDDKAFFIISDVREVHGEGFINHNED